jgi:hypothetical protein
LHEETIKRQTGVLPLRWGGVYVGNDQQERKKVMQNHFPYSVESASSGVSGGAGYAVLAGPTEMI